MRVGVDARAAVETPAGRGRVVRELLREFSAAGADVVAYAREPWDGAPDVSWRLVRSRDPLWHAASARFASRDCDVFLSTNSYLTAWMTTVPTAVIVYDLVAFEPGARAQKRAARIERATIRPALRRADSLICISEATERDLLRHFPSASGKTVTIPLAARPVEPAAGVRERFSLERPFVLCTGTLEPRKNLPRLVEAFARLERRDVDLVLVGPEGWELDAALEGVDREGVRVLGFVSDEDLAALYAECAVFAYPSLYEGFGLPVLEAMAAGAPVLTSDVSSLPEVGGDAVRYVDPLSVDSIRSGLAELLGDAALRADLTVRGRARAAGFSWERTAREYLAALSAIAPRA